MPPKFNLAERAKKGGITPIGLAPVLPKGPILATDTPFFLDEEKSRLQEITGTQKSRFIANAEDIEDRANEFLTLPVNYWFGVSVFFFITVNLYMKDIESSLTMKNKLNKMIAMGWTILPKWVKKKLPLDSILTLPTNLQAKTLPNLSR